MDGNVAVGASVGRLELTVPTATRPLRVKVQRIGLVVQQLRLPKVGWLVGRCAVLQQRCCANRGLHCTNAGVQGPSTVNVALLPCRLLQALPPEARAAAQHAQQEVDRAARLAVVEQLLWGAGWGQKGQQRPSRWNPAGAQLERPVRASCTCLSAGYPILPAVPHLLGAHAPPPALLAQVVC